MQVSFEWVKEFADISASADEVAERLTMAGLEIEGADKRNDDTVFEVNVTPNRPDCLSILGVAREAAAAFSVPLRIPDTDIKEEENVSDIQIGIANEDLCSRYSGRLIKGVTVCETPEWIRQRLEKCGLRPLNNNIVDITNYVLLEFGHPLHAFDADKLSGRLIKVEVAGSKKSIVTLDGIERKLPPGALLIWDAERPVAVAGIMGGEDTGVTADTKNVFLESAYFDPASIRRTSKELGLRSESSYRFERGTDIDFLEKALNRAALLIKETGGGEICRINDVYPVKHQPEKVEVSYSRVNALLGTSLKNTEILEILERVGLKTEDKGDIFFAYPPAFRRDITQYVDVIEEVARIYGYTNIPVKTPRADLSDGILNSKELDSHKIKEAIRCTGFTEVINFSFLNPSDLDLLLIPEDDIRRKSVKLRNPLRQEESTMRTLLVPSLINNFLYNFSRGARDIRFFEFSKIFINSGRELPVEELHLGGIFYSETGLNIWKNTVPGFFVVKGSLQALFNEMKIKGLSFVHSKEIFLHAGKSADIMLDDRKIGFIGELGPNVVENLNLKVRKPEITVFELNTDMMLSFLPERMTYSQIPKYPLVERDMALILEENIQAADVLKIISEYKSEYIEHVELFDHYKGKNIPSDKKSLAFRVRYRAKDRTLTDSEVESDHNALVDYVRGKTGGELRGRA